MDKKCTMKEYIEREALIAEYDRRYYPMRIGEPPGARKLIENAPTADVVEVVRCKDCKRFVDNKEAFVTYCQRELKNITVRPYDFCSYGERRTE